jgi:hypothetical protein
MAEIGVVQIGVVAALAQQLLVGPFFEDAGRSP